MGAFSDRLTATSLRLLKAYGQYIACHSEGYSAFDPATGEATATGRSDYDAWGYPSNYRLSQIDGNLIRDGDILLILSSTTVPQLNDIFDISGITYTALNIQRITTQGETVIYKIQVRV